jgi:hypothetical protein
MSINAALYSTSADAVRQASKELSGLSHDAKLDLHITPYTKITDVMRDMKRFHIVAVHDKDFYAVIPEITAFFQKEQTNNPAVPMVTVVIGMFTLPINLREFLVMIDNLPKQGNAIEIPVVKGRKTESVGNIVYFENKNRRVNIKTIIETYPTTLSMKAAYELTAAHLFSSPYVSYLVNLQWVERIAGRDVIMKNKDVIPLSQKRAARFRREYRTYMSTL